MKVVYERQENGDYWRHEYREDGSRMATFYAAARQVLERAEEMVVVDHRGEPISFTGHLEGHDFIDGRAPKPHRPDPLERARAQYASAGHDMHAKLDAIALALGIRGDE